MAGLSARESRVIFITGAASGIGATCAMEFARRGSRLILTDVNSMENTRQECVKAGVAEQNICCVMGDLLNEDDINRIVETGLQCFGTVHVIVNSAGHDVPGGITAPLAKLDLAYQLFFRAVFIICKKFVPYLKQNKGCIVNISSICAKVAYWTNGTPYAIMKAAQDHFTRCLALELAPDGVRVNAINPGVIATEGHLISVNITTQEEAEKYFRSCEAKSPLGRNGTPRQIASAVAYLASQDADFITGNTMLIDGGWILKSGISGHGAAELQMWKNNSYS